MQSQIMYYVMVSGTLLVFFVNINTRCFCQTDSLPLAFKIMFHDCVLPSDLRDAPLQQTASLLVKVDQFLVKLDNEKVGECVVVRFGF
jgi:hypothetical protein